MSEWRRVVGGERQYTVPDSLDLSYRDPDYWGGDTEVTFHIDFRATVRDSELDKAAHIDATVECDNEEEAQQLCEGVLEYVKQWYEEHPTGYLRDKKRRERAVES